MMSGCPTKVITANGMEMCMSAGQYCQFGENINSDICQGTIGNFAGVINDGFNTGGITFDQNFVKSLMGSDEGLSETPISLMYNIGVPTKNDKTKDAIHQLAAADHPYIYRTIISGIHRGRCSMEDIKNSTCNASTAISCNSNGTKGNLFPMSDVYRNDYEATHTLTNSQKSLNGLGGCSDPTICGNPCIGDYTQDWTNNENPYNPYAKWAASHGNGRIYTFPFDDVRGNAHPNRDAVHLDIVVFPECGTWAA
jgi:hypothetical protein